MEGIYRLDRASFNELTMRARGVRPDGTSCEVEGTWCWAPALSFYDRERGQWIEWIWVEERIR